MTRIGQLETIADADGEIADSIASEQFISISLTETQRVTHISSALIPKAPKLDPD